MNEVICVSTGEAKDKIDCRNVLKKSLESFNFVKVWGSKNFAQACFKDNVEVIK